MNLPTSPAVIPTAPPTPGEDWTHRDLAEHLTKNGVKVKVLPAGLPHTSLGVPVAFLAGGENTSSPMVVAYLCRDQKQAREQSATLGAEAFAAGRFAIGLARSDTYGTNDTGLLRRVSTVLKK